MPNNSSKNRFQKLFSLIFCAAILGGCFVVARAQSATLADGNPPLTRQMVERYAAAMEWSLDVRFSEQDRAKLEKYLVEYWTTNDRKNIQAILDTLAFERNLASASEAKKRAVPPQLKQKLLEAMRGDAEDTVNKLLLEVYERTETQTGAEDDFAASGATDLSALAGTWRVLRGNSIVSVDQPSGRIGDGNSMIAEYDIRPDGRVRFTFVLQQSNYGCTTRVKSYKTGRAAVSGSRVTFAYDAGGTTVSEDNCNARYNYTKKLAAEKETFDFELKSENGKPQFCFASAKLKDCAIKVK